VFHGYRSKTLILSAIWAALIKIREQNANLRGFAGLSRQAQNPVKAYSGYTSAHPNSKKTDASPPV
jgi:hypothetical protein